MTIKKLTVLLMTLAMAVLLTACGSDPAPQKTTSSGNGIVGAAEKAPEMPTAKVGGKTLVVYYSGTGRTRTAAEAIAAATQGPFSNWYRSSRTRRRILTTIIKIAACRGSMKTPPAVMWRW